MVLSYVTLPTSGTPGNPLKGAHMQHGQSWMARAASQAWMSK